MYSRLTIVSIASALAATAVCAQDKPQLTVDELVAKNVAAKGGADALRALQSVRFTGKMLVNEGQFQLAYVETKKRPGEVRSEATLQGMTAIQAYDGEQAWKVYPFQGRKDPEKMSADDTKSLIEEAEIDGPLVNWKAKGSTVEYLGTEDVDGTSAHKLKVVRNSAGRARRTGGSRDRYWRLRKNRRRLSSVFPRIRPKRWARQTKNRHRQGRAQYPG